MAESTSTSTTASSAAKTRKTAATKRSTTARKAATTRAANRGAAARADATAKTKATARARGSEATGRLRGSAERAGELAETVVLVPVGAALVARDQLRAHYGTRAKARQELRRFERRGSTAVKGIERDAKKTRTRVEKELKRVVKRTDPIVKNVELVGARIENAYEHGRSVVTRASTSVQERIASVA